MSASLTFPDVASDAYASASSGSLVTSCKACWEQDEASSWQATNCRSCMNHLKMACLQHDFLFVQLQMLLILSTGYSNTHKPVDFAWCICKRLEAGLCITSRSGHPRGLPVRLQSQSILQRQQANNTGSAGPRVQKAERASESAGPVLDWLYSTNAAALPKQTIPGRPKFVSHALY